MDSSDDDPKGPGFPIRRSTDQRVLAPPRGLSQRATSFIASQCQGIHQMPLSRLIRSFRNVTRRDKSLHLSLSTSVTQHFPHCRPQASLDVMNAIVFEQRRPAPWRREKTPPTASHTFLSTMSKIETNLQSLPGSRPCHRSSARKTAKLSALRRAQLAQRWWS
jgi:hypothetical protein